MASSTLTPAEELHALLNPSTTEGKQALEKNDTLKKLSNQYKAALETQNVKQLPITIGNIARELHEQNLLSVPAERVVETFDLRPYETRVEEADSASSERSSSSLREFLPKESPSHGGGVTTVQEAANGALKEKVQGSVQQEFAKLLATTRPDDLPGAIEQFYHTHLSAAGIVGSQYQVLIDQSKKLYGGKEEFDKHVDALEKARNETVAPLEDVHQIGPIRPGKTEADSKALYRQRELERTNIRNLQMIAQTQPKNLTRAMNQVFDAEWARREDDAVMQEFVNELRTYNHSHSTIYEDFAAPVVAVTTTAQLYEQEQGTTQVAQGQTFSNASQGGTPGVVRNLGQRAKNLAKDQLKKRLRRKAEEELAEQAVKQGALTALRSGFSALISAIGGWPVVLAIAIIVLVAVIVIVILVSIAGGNNNNGSAGTGSGSRPQIAEIIVQHLTQGSDGYYNKINPNPFPYPGSSYLVKERGPNPPGYEDSTDSGYIFCTSLVVDVFNISGVALPEYLGNVNNMIAYMKTTKGYRYIDYWDAKRTGNQAQMQSLLSQVQPGDSIFYANTGYCGSAAYCHTGIVYAVKLNSSGDGYIETREANTPITRRKLPVSSWYINNYADAASFGVGGL